MPEDHCKESACNNSNEYCCFCRTIQSQLTRTDLATTCMESMEASTLYTKHTNICIYLLSLEFPTANDACHADTTNSAYTRGHRMEERERKPEVKKRYPTLRDGQTKPPLVTSVVVNGTF